MTTSIIYDEDRVVLVTPTFRLSVYLPMGALASPGAQAFLDGFEALVWPDVERVAGTMISRKEKFFDKKPKHLAAVREHWRQPVADYRLSEARFFGMADGYSNLLPLCLVYETLNHVVIDVAVRPDVDRTTFVERLWEPLLAAGPIFAICGYAMAPDPLGHGYPRLMALRAKRRYQMAWCMHAEMSEGSIDARTVRIYNEKKGDAAQPGIPDAGWKTVVGGPFLPQIDPAAIARIPGASVRDVGGAVEITVGPEPRWGDANVPEDVTAYAAVCRALAPIRASKSMLRNRGIFADADDLTESVEAYYRLWEA